MRSGRVPYPLPDTRRARPATTTSPRKRSWPGTLTSAARRVTERWRRTPTIPPAIPRRSPMPRRCACGAMRRTRRSRRAFRRWRRRNMRGTFRAQAATIRIGRRNEAMDLNRRELLAGAGKFLILSRAAQAVLAGTADAEKYKAADHWWGMTIDVSRCIGCGNCVRACAKENDVPAGYFRTWVERYHVNDADLEHPVVESPDGGMNGFPAKHEASGKNFFVPKLCNHCVDSPCIQACPVGATYDSPDGVVLIDQKYCIG